MCGIVAYNSVSTINTENRDAIVKSMYSMRFRGPDGEGLWSDTSIIMGHRRLAVIDPDVQSAQPMASPCGRYRIVFNGEIYNYRELRSQAIAWGIKFNTQSDTEVVLAMYARHGEAMLPLLRGMFAFVIWDCHKNEGFAARDPYGIKPLYYSQSAEGIWFASQVKALMATRQISREPCLDGQSGFWLTGSVPEPHTWFEAVKALPAGHLVYFDNGQLSGPPSCWWDVATEFTESCVSTTNMLEHVRAALLDSVRAHLVADVPIGVFLSGGIDSGSLASMITELGYRNLHGVTIGFRDFEGRHENEVPIAAEIAHRLGIHHHVRWVTKDEFEADLPRIVEAMDQPSIDGINTWFACKAVAELGLKVVVSGVGGDELFQGYSTFQRVPSLQRKVSIINAIPGVRNLFRRACLFQASRRGNRRWADIPEMAATIQGAWLLSRGLFSISELPEIMDVQANAHLSDYDYISRFSLPKLSDPVLTVAQMESVFYLRNQLLRDSDWASMAHSVELRTPLVDAHLLRRITPHLSHFRDFPNKSLLSGSVRPTLPEEVINRNKTGFGIPMDAWLPNGPSAKGKQSREWAQRASLQYDSNFAA